MCASETLSEVTVLSAWMSAKRTDSRDMHELIALVEFQGLVSLNDQISVGLHFHHRHRQTAGQTIALGARALAVKAVGARQGRGENRHTPGGDGLAQDRRPGVVH